MSTPPAVAYVLSSYPVLREYFYHLEISGLREEGIDVHVVSLLDRDPAGTEDWDIRSEKLFAILYRNWRTWMDAGAEWVAQPVTFLKAFAAALRPLWPRPKDMLYAGGLSIKALVLARRLRRANIQVVHAAWGTWPAYVAWLVRRLEPGIRFTVTYVAHDYDVRFPLTPMVVNDADLVFTVAKARQHQLRYQWPKTDRPVVCVYQGTHLPEGGNHQSRRNGLLCVAGITPHKGVDVLLAALHLLKQQGSDLQLTIIGPTPPEDEAYAAQLQEQIRQSGLQHQVDWRGPQPHPAVMQAMREAELFVLASLWNDVLPNVLREALACGTPVVTTDSLGIDELVQDGVTGRVVAKGDVAALAEAIKFMITHPQQAQEMARAGRKRVLEQSDIRVTSRQRADYFRQVIAAS